LSEEKIAVIEKWPEQKKEIWFKVGVVIRCIITANGQEISCRFPMTKKSARSECRQSRENGLENRDDDVYEQIPVKHIRSPPLRL
jgi:hypothetical protein